MKNIFIVLIIMCSFFTFNIKVNAEIPIKAGVAKELDSSNTKCEDYGLGDPDTPGTTANYMQQVFDIMKFAGIVLAIVMTIKDLITAVSEQKNDTYAKLGQKSLKRIIYAIAIFLLPALINLLFNLLGLYGGTCNIK